MFYIFDIILAIPLCMHMCKNVFCHFVISPLDLSMMPVIDITLCVN